MAIKKNKKKTNKQNKHVYHLSKAEVIWLKVNFLNKICLLSYVKTSFLAWQRAYPQVSWWRNQMEAFSALLALCAGEFTGHRWRGALMFSFICAWINGWVNNGKAGDSSNGIIFRVNGPLCREFTGDRWIPLTKASDADIWCFLWDAIVLIMAWLQCHHITQVPVDYKGGGLAGGGACVVCECVCVSLFHVPNGFAY